MTRDRTAEPSSQDQILRREQGQENICLSLQQLIASRIGNIITRLIHILL